MLFIIVTLALQAFSPAVAAPSQSSTGLQAAQRPSLIAAACARPNADAKVLDAVPPSLPHGAKASGVVNALVTIAPNGHVMDAKVVRSSGNASIDGAVLAAARKSTYSAKVANCAAVEGQYVYHVEFSPSP
jgi:TonB family protein